MKLPFTSSALYIFEGTEESKYLYSRDGHPAIIPYELFIEKEKTREKREKEELSVRTQIPKKIFCLFEKSYFYRW